MDVQDELTKAVLSAAATVSIEKLVNRVSKKNQNSIDPGLVKERLRNHARVISSVKTLLSTDTQVPIAEFYCVPSVRFGKQRFVANKSDDFRQDHVLIEGVAGQGKSILLRHLCANSILNGGKVAVFYELRRLDHLKPLTSIVFETLNQFGLPGKSESLKTLSAERDVEIYLDGFDELSQKDAEKVDRDLNFFANTFPLVKIFVSARPHVGLARNGTLHAYRIESLDKPGAYQLIDKLCREPGLAEGLKDKLNAHQGRVSELLETPLLVTLLVAKYAQTQQIPEHLSEFYGSIFQTLFEKHDNFKLPFRRTKRLAISTLNYEKLFEQFCFGSLFVDALTSEKAVELAKWSMSSRKIPGEPSDLLSDISDISSLINDDHGLWSFIHTSVQEFYAADFLLSGTDEELKKHAGILVGLRNAATREQIFRFACELDEFRYKKFVELPFFEKLASPLSSIAEAGATQPDVKRWLKAHAHEIAFDKNFVDGGYFFSVYTDCVEDTPIRLFASETNISIVKEAVIGRSAPEAIDLLFEIPVVKERLFNEAKKRVDPLLMKLVAVRAGVKALSDEREERDRIFSDLISGSL